MLPPRASVLRVLVLATFSLPGLAQEVRVLRVPAGGSYPDVVQGSDGRVHLAFARGGEVAYASAGSAADSWGEPEVLSAGREVVGPERGPFLALGWRDTVHLTWQIHHEKPGAWGMGLRSFVPGQSGWGAAGGQGFQGAPESLSELKGGTVSVVAQGTDSLIFIGPPTGMRGDTGLTGDGVVWTRSTDLGKSFGKVEEIRTSIPIAASPFAMPAAWIDPQGRLRIACRGASGREAGLFVLAEGDESHPFSVVPVARLRPSEEVSEQNEEGPRVATDPTGRRVIVAWKDGEDVAFSLSGNAGDRFSAPVRPHAVRTPSSRVLPRVAWGRGDEFLLAWLEGTWIGWEIRRAGGKVLGEGQVMEGVDPTGGFDVFASQDGTFYVVH